MYECISVLIIILFIYLFQLPATICGTRVSCQAVCVK